MCLKSGQLLFQTAQNRDSKTCTHDTDKTNKPWVRIKDFILTKSKYFKTFVFLKEIQSNTLVSILKPDSQTTHRAVQTSWESLILEAIGP